MKDAVWIDSELVIELFSACSKLTVGRHVGEWSRDAAHSAMSFRDLGLELGFDFATQTVFPGTYRVRAHANSLSELARQVRAGIARLRIGPFPLPEKVTWAHAGGWQCWSDSPILRETATLLGEPDFNRRVFGDSFFYPYEERPGVFHSWFTSWCGSELVPDAHAFFAAASERFAAAFVFNIPGRQFFIDIDVEGWSQQDFEIAWLVPTELRSDHELGRQMRSWQQYQLNEPDTQELHPRPQISPLGPLPLRGYTSWYHHYQKINLHAIEQNASSLKENMRVFQIDDGYQSAVGDWMSLSPSFGTMEKFEKFLLGLREKKITPGIWLAPFVTVKSSQLAQQHDDWFLRSRDGSLVRAGHIPHWGGDFFALDTEKEDVRKWIKDVIAFWTRRGVGFFKCDFLYAPGIAIGADREDQTLTRFDRARRAHAFLYECVREQNAVLLSCGAIMSQAAGACDFSRIGADVGQAWDDPNSDLRWSREKVSTRAAITNAITRFPWSGAGLLCDGDVTIVRSYDTNLDHHERELLADVNALASDLQFVSCDLFNWTDSARDTYSRLCASPLGSRPECLRIDVPSDGWSADGVAERFKLTVRSASGEIKRCEFNLSGQKI